MSIIYEALRDIQKKQENIPPSVSNVPQDKPFVLRKKMLLVISLAVSCTAFFSFFLLPNKKAPVEMPLMVKEESVSLTLPEEVNSKKALPNPQGPTEKDAARQVQLNPPPLSLTGILAGGQQNIAIINHRLVKTGETIEGYEILEIKQEEILAKRAGRIFVFKLQR